MIKNNVSYKEVFKYIVLFIISFFCMAFVQSTESYADAPSQIEVSDVGGTMKGYWISSNTCTSWKKPGTGCSVTIISKGTAGSECRQESKLTFNFTRDASKTEYGSYKPTGATGSSHCRYQATVEVFNYDYQPPYRSAGSSVQLLSGTCDKSSVTQGGSITCSGNAEFVGLFFDDHSGPGSITVRKSCSAGATCKIFATDNVGNTSDDNQPLNSLKAPYEFTVNKDTTKCSNTTISITNGTSYNGYYVGTVTCAARCTADNLAIGGTKYGSTTGSTCSAQACDRAGNCTSKSVSVKRDYTPPTCSQQNISSDGLINGYRMGNVSVSWKRTDSQSGCRQGTYTQSTLNNTTTSLSQSISDKASNNKTCSNWNWPRDTRAPSACNFSLSDFSNSSITATAWCSSDSESGCSPDRKYRTYYDNGSYTGGNGIAIYDMTEKYRASPTNYMNCPITINKIDRVPPTCSATTTVANPVLAPNGKSWSTNTWHNNADVIYDENGNVVANSKKRVQGYLNSTYDNASAGGNASGIKSGFTSGTALGSLNQEARTEYNDGSQNGLYTIFSRDRITDNVTNNLAGWSGSTLYAHGVTTSGNVGTCQVSVYSFDNNKNSYDLIIT